MDPKGETHVLDLARYRGSVENRVLAGREEGKQVRKVAKVEQLDQLLSIVEVKIPQDLFSLTSSYFLGLFGDSIRELGEARFREHYRFTGKSISRVIDDAVQSVALTRPFA